MSKVAYGYLNRLEGASIMTNLAIHSGWLGAVLDGDATMGKHARRRGYGIAMRR